MICLFLANADHPTLGNGDTNFHRPLPICLCREIPSATVLHRAAHPKKQRLSAADHGGRYV